MALAQGVDVEEGEGLVTLEELEAGDFSYYYFIYTVSLAVAFHIKLLLCLSWVMK